MLREAKIYNVSCVNFLGQPSASPTVGEGALQNLQAAQQSY